MGRANWLADKLREFGCNVVEIEGWQLRGSATFNPQGVVIHHTAGPLSGDAPSLGICINGRTDLPGPLCNVFLSRSGVVYVVASGRANHAGLGGYNGLSGNSSVFGIEAENTGVGESWGAVQLDAYYRICAAMLSGIGRGAEWVIAHREWTSRKIDPRGIDMPGFRAQVQAKLNGGAAIPPPPQPAPAPPANTPGILKVGSRGAEVVRIQQILNFWGWNAGAEDGIFGPGTEAAVKRAQAALRVPADGIWGPKTEEAYGGWLFFIAAASAAAKSRPTLRIGDRGDHVVYLQQRLSAHGYGTNVDGIYGPATQRNVLRFQAAKGTGADGIVGPITWRLLG